MTAPEFVTVVYGRVLKRRGRLGWEIRSVGEKDDAEMPSRIPPAGAFPAGTTMSISVPSCPDCYSELPSATDGGYGCACRDWAAWNDQWEDE